MSARQWYRVQNAANDPTVAEIHIIDFIGDWTDDAINRFWNEEIGITARAFVEDLAGLPESVKSIHVHINSPGGDVQGGINIANALREQHSKGRVVETFIDGIAASIASVIAMAGSKVHMADNALLMVHDPWTIGIGNSAEMRKLADILDTMKTKQVIASYKWHSTLSEDEISALMSAETWMSADEALERGFVTDKVEGLRAAASITPGAAASLRVPEKYQDRVKAFIKPAPSAPQPMDAAAVLELCTASDLDIVFAQALLKERPTEQTAKARIDTEKTARAERKGRADAITKLCANAKVPNLADGYIKGAMSVDDVKAHLTTITAAMDKAEIDANIDPAAGAEQVKTSWNKALKRAGVLAGARR